MKGKHLWEQLVNQYIELTENCRFNIAELSIFAKFLHYARTANNNISDYIDEKNKAWLDYIPTISDKCNNPNILWLADKNPDVSRINRDKLQQLLQTISDDFTTQPSATTV